MAEGNSCIRTTEMKVNWSARKVLPCQCSLRTHNICDFSLLQALFGGLKIGEWKLSQEASTAARSANRLISCMCTVMLIETFCLHTYSKRPRLFRDRLVPALNIEAADYLCCHCASKSDCSKVSASLMQLCRVNS